MSTSDQDYSESSNADSPQSLGESPYSSPSQQVPHLANVFSGITCADDITMHDGSKPFLRVVEQPQNYFRFRYKSEMVGTHGCLLGKSTNTSKNKTHPTVELVNYTGKALIRVRLSQSEKDEEHPHKLLEDEQEDRDVSAAVPEQGSYKVGFAGMGIIHTAKKDVPGLLFKKYVDRLHKMPAKELRAYCENTAKTINLNIVRLRFSAHDVNTDKEICPPVFSEPIHNMKSAATNDLKICRISRYFGRPRGGDDVFILVEKVNKKNIIIRFYELDENGEECWTATGNFLQSDVHHQYAIVFRTPPYKSAQITRDVKVLIELVRPSDGRTSEPKEFVYKADQVFRQNKRRRVNSSFSSFESVSGGSIKSLSEVPATVEMINNHDRGDEMSNIPVYQINIPHVPVAQPMSQAPLGDALLYASGGDSTPTGPVLSPMLGQPNTPDPPVICINSSEFERLINDDLHIPSEERKRFLDTDWTEYMQSFGENMDKTNSMDYIRLSTQLVADSGRSKAVVKTEPVSPSKSTSSGEEKKTNIVEKSKANSEYNAVYKAEDGVEVKKLVKEICDIIKTGTFKKQVVRNKLEKLLDMRLSNGDTFLHMTLSSNQPSFEYIIKLIHSMNMPQLLNLTNDLQQTILHLAVVHDLPRLVALLVAKGCDPMMADKEGCNAIHYAVEFQACLAPLLEAIKTNDIACDLNAYNFEKQTALHLAAIYDSEASARLLLRHGANCNARDSEGRTPLHLAIYDDFLGVTRALLDYTLPSDIDAVDGRGNTALQIVSGAGVRENTLAIVRLLLDRKADALKHDSCNLSAWALSAKHLPLREVLRAHLPAHQALEDDVKSEPEDDYESADEELQDNLVELPLYVGEVSALLDASGGWRQLAEKARAGSLASWFANTRSPARTLLLHLKETGDNITSKSLSMYLRDIGELDAAFVVRKYIE